MAPIRHDVWPRADPQAHTRLASEHLDSVLRVRFVKPGIVGRVMGKAEIKLPEPRSTLEEDGLRLTL